MPAVDPGQSWLMFFFDNSLSIADSTGHKKTVSLDVIKKDTVNEVTLY